jgi:hypothetical protein
MRCPAGRVPQGPVRRMRPDRACLIRTICVQQRERAETDAAGNSRREACDCQTGPMFTLRAGTVEAGDCDGSPSYLAGRNLDSVPSCPELALQDCQRRLNFDPWRHPPSRTVPPPKRVICAATRLRADDVCIWLMKDLVFDTTVRALRHLMVRTVKTIWAKARPTRCPRPGRRSDQAPPINDRASAGPTTRS